MRLCSTVANSDQIFYTDLNGLQLVRRKTVDKLPLQGNFYPMPTTALLQDETHRLSLLAAQTHGVASLKTGEPHRLSDPVFYSPLPPGWLEAVLDRRLAKDDERGLGQGVKDNKVTAANFRLLLETRTQPAKVKFTNNVATTCIIATYIYTCSHNHRVTRRPHPSWPSLPSCL